MNNRRPSNARRIFVDAVRDEMKALDEDYDHEVAKGMWPFVKLADAMLRDDIEKLRKKRQVRPPKQEAAE